MSGGGEAPPADPETSEIISASRRTQHVALYALGIVTSPLGLPSVTFNGDDAILVSERLIENRHGVLGVQVTQKT